MADRVVRFQFDYHKSEGGFDGAATAAAVDCDFSFVLSALLPFCLALCPALFILFSSLSFLLR